MINFEKNSKDYRLSLQEIQKKLSIKGINKTFKKGEIGITFLFDKNKLKNNPLLLIRVIF